MKISLPSAALSILILLHHAAAQQAPTPAATPAPERTTPARYEGCVAKLPNVERYVLATGNRCMLLAGGFNPKEVADHLVVLHGLLLEPTGMDPLTLKVDAPAVIKNACTETCKLVPPGTRGVHGKEKPGSEGGPPGAVKPPDQP